MDTLIKADIFFAVTTIAVVVITIVMVVGMFYIIMAIRTFKVLIDNLSSNVTDTSEYVKDLVDDVRESFIFSFLFQKKSKKKSNKIV